MTKEKMIKTINNTWEKLKDGCEDYNPKYYRGYPHFTEDWCSSNRNRARLGLGLGHCSMSSCPLLR